MKLEPIIFIRWADVRETYPSYSKFIESLLLLASYIQKQYPY